MEILAQRPEWHQRAACRGTAADGRKRNPFFPERGQPVAAVREICADCPVRQECADFAIEIEAWMPGIWGGLSEIERRKLRAARRREMAS